jgi:hypothetical protein
MMISRKRWMPRLLASAICFNLSNEVIHNVIDEEKARIDNLTEIREFVYGEKFDK